MPAPAQITLITDPNYTVAPSGTAYRQWEDAAKARFSGAGNSFANQHFSSGSLYWMSRTPGHILGALLLAVRATKDIFWLHEADRLMMRAWDASQILSYNGKQYRIWRRGFGSNPSDAWHHMENMLWGPLEAEYVLACQANASRSLKYPSHGDTTYQHRYNRWRAHLESHEERWRIYQVIPTSFPIFNHGGASFLAHPRMCDAAYLELTAQIFSNSSARRVGRDAIINKARTSKSTGVANALRWQVNSRNVWTINHFMWEANNFMNANHSTLTNYFSDQLRGHVMLANTGIYIFPMWEIARTMARVFMYKASNSMGGTHPWGGDTNGSIGSAITRLGERYSGGTSTMGTAAAWNDLHKHRSLLAEGGYPLALPYTDPTGSGETDRARAIIQLNWSWNNSNIPIVPLGMLSVLAMQHRGLI